METQKITRAALLIGVCVVLGYVFMPIPNLELITAGIFLSGIWMGPRLGLFVGIVAEAIFSIFNPMGFPPPPLLMAQVVSMGLVGWVGGLSRNRLINGNFFSARRWYLHIYLALLGFTLTLCFDMLTTLSFPIAAGFNLEQIRIAVVLGIPFVAMHLIINAFTFAVVIPIFLNRFKGWRTQ